MLFCILPPLDMGSLVLLSSHVVVVVTKLLHSLSDKQLNEHRMIDKLGD